MSRDLALLYKLQAIDTGIAERKRALAKLDNGATARADLSAAEAELEEARKKLQQTRTTLQDKELRLASTEEQRKQKHDRCYGGTVSDPKELRALEMKIEELTSLKGKLEEELLLLMDRAEEEEQAVQKAEDVVRRLRAHAEDVEAHFSMETKRLKQEIADLEEQRKNLLPQISSERLKMYDTLRERLGGVAVAAVVDFTCTACHTAVPRDQAERILTSTTPIRCENCKRILWIPGADSED